MLLAVASQVLLVVLFVHDVVMWRLGVKSAIWFLVENFFMARGLLGVDFVYKGTMYRSMTFMPSLGRRSGSSKKPSEHPALGCMPLLFYSYFSDLFFETRSYRLGCNVLHCFVCNLAAVAIRCMSDFFCGLLSEILLKQGLKMYVVVKFLTSRSLLLTDD